MSERDELMADLARLSANGRTSEVRAIACAACNLLERDGVEIARLRAYIQEMVEKAAAKSLDGYRELGARAAAAENELDAARAALAEAQRDAGRYRWLVNAGSENSPIARAQAVYHLWNGEDGADGFTRALDAAIAKEPVQVPAGECPYPIRQDHSIAACVEAGDCGCGARDDGTTREG